MSEEYHPCLPWTYDDESEVTRDCDGDIIMDAEAYEGVPVSPSHQKFITEAVNNHAALKASHAELHLLVVELYCLWGDLESEDRDAERKIIERVTKALRRRRSHREESSRVTAELS